jgi:hypothetical protein
VLPSETVYCRCAVCCRFHVSSFSALEARQCSRFELDYATASVTVLTD